MKRSSIERRASWPGPSRDQSANVVHLLGYRYSSDLARVVRQANASVRLDVKEDYDRGTQRLVQRSDNWPFLEPPRMRMK